MRWVAISLALAIQLIPVRIAQAQSPQVEEITLENGLKVFLLENHKSPAVTFQVWYHVGSRNELDGKSGLSHFLEHMMFKGTAEIAPEEHSRIIAKNGGRYNAFTSQDATVYFATMSREKIGIAIELEADRMVNARMDGEYFAREKAVVIEERRLRTEDNPSQALAEVTGAVTYTVHPYRRPVIGWMQDLRNLTLHDLKSYYQTYYSPNNAFVVVVGDFAPTVILAKIKATFGQIPRRPDPPKVKITETPQRGERRVTLKKEAELPYLLIHYHVPSLKDPDSYALDLLTVILASGRSSRLFRDLVYGQRLARRVSADYSGLSIDPTVLSISAQAMPGKSAAEVEHAIDQVLEQIRSEPIGARELQKAKNQVEADTIFRQDSIFGQGMRIGRYEISVGLELMDRYLEEVRKLTAADLLRVARTYLAQDRRTVGTLIPTEEDSR
ncbi:MAG: M16 family metallopeptidase [Candidatus Binatia bacterium]